MSALGPYPFNPSEPLNKGDNHLAIDKVKKTSYCDVVKDVHRDPTPYPIGATEQGR